MSDTIYMIVGNFLIYFITLLFLIFYYKDSLKKEWKDFLGNWLEYLKKAVFTFLKGISFMIIVNLIILSFLSNLPQNEEINRNIITTLPIFSVISMIFLGPFIEELLFRKGLKNAFSNKFAYSIFSGFLFGFAHILASLDFGSFSAFLNSLPECLFLISYGGIGYFLAEAYYETDNIFVSTIAHMIQNTLGVSLILLGALL